MAQNVELKARVLDPEGLRRRAEAIATNGPQVIFQDDTFFVCATGRLKLRDFGNGHGELIYYQRPDEEGPKTSFYLITPTADPGSLRDLMEHACGVIGRVRKQRLVYLVGRTRIHLDRVDGLGDFMELEVVLARGESAEIGEAEASALLEQLGIDRGLLLSGAYLDLLAEQARTLAA